jgi:hypothetical protein
VWSYIEVVILVLVFYFFNHIRVLNFFKFFFIIETRTWVFLCLLMECVTLIGFCMLNHI